MSLFGIDGLTPARRTPVRTYAYGTHPAQVCDLHLPEGPPPAGSLRGVVVLVHGGYWRARYDRSLEGLVADDLVACGWAVWNLDYRAVGDGPNDGGGWPATYEDVAAAADLLVDVAAEHTLPLDRCVVVGHSAGGALALWLAARHRLTSGATGSHPRLRPAAVVAQAALCDLADAAEQRLGAGAVLDLFGGRRPDDAPGAYATADPSSLLPLGVPVLVVTGDADDAVPHRQSLAFAAAARAAGDDVTLDVDPGGDHFVHVLPASPAWQRTRAWLDDRAGSFVSRTAISR